MKKMKIEELPKLTDEKVEAYWNRFMEYLESNKESIKDQFVRALWKGVGKLDENSASIVYREISHICNKHYIDGLLAGAMDIDMNYPFTIEQTTQLYRRLSDMAIGHAGHAQSSCNGCIVKLGGNKFSRCACPFATDTPVKMFDWNENQCNYCGKEGFKTWFEIMLQKPVVVTKGDKIGPHGFVKGGSCDNWNIEVQER